MATQTLRYPLTRQCRGGAARLESQQSWFDGAAHLVIRRWTQAEAEVAFTSDLHSLILTLDGGTALTGSRVGGDLIYEGADRPGALTFAPSGADRVGWYRAADMRFIALYLDPERVDPAFGFAKAAEGRPEVNGADPVIEGLLRSLAQEMDAGLELDPMLMEHVLSLVALRLARRAGARLGSPPNGARLRERQLKRVSEHVEAHLADDLSVTDLAAVAQMSNDSFARAFKKTTGQTPYRYLLQRRVRRAETLLADTDEAIARVAYAAGFSSQSHLTTTFRRINGLTPHAFRRAHRR